MVQRDPGRVLLGLFLVPSRPGPSSDAVDDEIDAESLRVVGPLLLDDTVDREAKPASLAQLLEECLEIPPPQEAGFGQNGAEMRLDEAAGRLEAAIQVDGPQDGFEGVRQEGLLLSSARKLFAFPETEQRAESQGASDCRQACFGNKEDLVWTALFAGVGRSAINMSLTRRSRTASPRAIRWDGSILCSFA
jgi:hypothetical protein